MWRVRSSIFVKGGGGWGGDRGPSGPRNVAPERVREFGQFIAGYRNVSHCYQRPTYEDWPYTVFTMVHGRTGPEVHAVMAAIAQATGLTEHEILWSIKEYKKIRVKYFTPELDAWAKTYCEAAA